MDTISLHLDIQNSLNKTLKETQITMKSFNSLLENSQKSFTNISKTSDKVADNFDDIADDTERASKHTKTWGDRFSKISELAGKVGLGFAGFSIGGTIKSVLELDTAMKTLAFRMGEGGVGKAAETTFRALRDSVYETAKATGLTLEQSTELIKGLKHYRVATKDVEELGIATGQFSRITGVTADTTTRLTGQMVRYGKLSADAAKRVLTGMAQVQRQVGLTEGEMEQISATTIEATATLSQYGKSSAQIETFNKGIAKLAEGFASVGVSADKALKVIDDLLDPTLIEDNALLYAKLGISLQDVISGDVDPEELQRGFKNLGQELEGMGNMAAGQLAKSMGMTLRDLKAMADMGEGEGGGGKDLGGMLDEQLTIQEQMEKVSNTVKVTMAETADNFARTLHDTFLGPDGIMGFLKNKKVWLIGLLALIPLVLFFRKRLFAMATGFGKVLAKATTEAIAMGTEKGGIIAASKTRGRGRGRSAEKVSRVTSGTGYAEMQELAETFDVMAKSNLFPFMARMTEHTADWLRDISLGSKKTSLLTEKTDQINKSIRDRLGMRKTENAMMTERLKDLKQESVARITALEASKREGMSEKEKKWIQDEIGKEQLKQGKLNDKIQKERLNIRGLEIKAIRRMGEEEQAAIMRRIKGEKERVEGQRASGKLQREGLRNQDVYLKAQINELAWERKALKEKAKSGHISADEVMQLRKIEDTMNDIVKKRGEAVALIHESLAADQEHKEALEGLAKENTRFTTAVGRGGRDNLESVGKSLMPESRTKRFLGFIGATFRKAGDGITDSFDKAKKTSKQFGANIVQKLNPVNWFKAIRSKMRGDTEEGEKKTLEEGKKNRNVMGKMGGFLGKLLPIAGIIGIAMKLLQPVMERLKPAIDAISKVFSSLVESLMPPFMKLFAAMFPLVAQVVNFLLPPIVWFLGQLVKVIGWMIEGIGSLLQGLITLPAKIGVAFDAIFNRAEYKEKAQAIIDAGKLNPEILAEEKAAAEEEIAILQERLKTASSTQGRAIQARIASLGAGGKELSERVAFRMAKEQETERRVAGVRERSPFFNTMMSITEKAQEFGQSIQGVGQEVVDFSKEYMGEGGKRFITNEVIQGVVNGLLNPQATAETGEGGIGGTPSGPSAAIFRAGANGTITKEQDAREAELENVEATKNATEETAGNTGAVLTEAEKQTKELQALNIGIYGLINTMRAKEGMAPMERPVY